MSNENVTNMVDSLTSGDNVVAQNAFKGALTDKIGNALDAKRQSVANDWLNAANEAEEIQDASGLDDISVASPGAIGTGVEPVDADAEVEPFEIDDESVEEE